MRVVVLIVTVAGVLLMEPGTAVASCAGPAEGSVLHSPVAFVGTVIGARGGYAKVQVVSVARGPDLAPVVWVQGGQDQPPFPMNMAYRIASSGDVEWTLGARYAIGAEPSLRTGNCSVYETGADTIRGIPAAEHRPPVAGGASGAPAPTSPILYLIGTGAAAVLFVVTMVLVGRALATKRSKTFSVRPSKAN